MNPSYKKKMSVSCHFNEKIYAARPLSYVLQEHS